MTLLRDALDRTLLEPHCALRWHVLRSAWQDSREPNSREAVIDELGQRPCADPRADILRLTFLAGASGLQSHEDAAVARVLEVEPEDPDRLAAFMAYRWLGALQTLGRRPDFVADLIAGRVPDMAARLVKSAADQLPAGFPARASDDIRRVAVVVPYVGHRFHTPSMMAVEQCIVLAREGIQVQVFSAQELLPADAALFRGDGRKIVLPPLEPKSWAGILPSGINMTISDARYSMVGRWRNLLAALAAFDPDAVLMVGLYSPLAGAMHRVRPVAGISVNTVAPIAPLDVWLTAGPESEPATSWGGVFPSPQAVHHPYRVKRPAETEPLPRAALEIDDKAVVWITAGFRLEHEIRDEWARRMLELVARYPQVVWLLVGGEGRLPPALSQAGRGRIRALATRADMPAILRSCDIYVNPPRMGGGFSVAEAMAVGLPVITLSGSDGGDKLGDLALPHLDACTERLAALIEDPRLRREMGEALRKRFDQRLDIAASGPGLLQACRRAASLARPRLGG